MAGDWIKIEHGLPSKPEVMQMATILGIDEMAVVGHLVCFWSWVSTNLSLNCPLAIGTKRGLDRVANRDGFVDAMVSVGWLTEVEPGKYEIPNYDHHLSKSAKTRANEQKKKAMSRKVSRFCPENVPDQSGQNRGPEKRREEKSNTHTHADGNPDWGNLPDWMQSAWDRWQRLWFAREGRWMDSIQAETIAMEVIRRGQQKGLEDLEFTIMHNGKSLLDSANDFQKRDARTGAKKNTQNGKELRI
jgi:hypothetical protein